MATIITRTDITGHIPMCYWGRDHWSTFMYLEVRCVDHDGVLKKENMRVDRDRHPQFAHLTSLGKEYPTRLKNDDHGFPREVSDHDDYDCIDDMMTEGLVTGNGGIGTDPTAHKLTDKGWALAMRLRQWRARGNRVETFEAGTL